MDQREKLTRSCGIDSIENRGKDFDTREILMIMQARVREMTLRTGCHSSQFMLQNRPFCSMKNQMI
jgi:hypothetical protein